MSRIVEIVAIRAGSVVKSGRAWHRQQKLLKRLQQARGRRRGSP